MQNVLNFMLKIHLYTNRPSEWQAIIHIACYSTFGQWSKWLIVERTQVIDRQETAEYITVTVSKISVRFTFAFFGEQKGFNLVKTERL